MTTTESFCRENLAVDEIRRVGREKNRHRHKTAGHEGTVRKSLLGLAEILAPILAPVQR